jgi:hypothetical protein
MAKILRKGLGGGEDVDALAKALVRELKDDAGPFAVLLSKGAGIDETFDAAIRRWQAGVGIIADGIVGSRCALLLNLPWAPALDFGDARMNVGRVSVLFPATKPANIARYLPYVEAALAERGLTDPPMVLGALGTIRAETEGFVPIDEFQSHFNTPPGGAPFSLYDGRRDLGNGPGEGAKFKGRGFVQLTGHSNYAKFGPKLGIDLVADPAAANAPEVAAALLAEFLLDKATQFRAAIKKGDLLAARKLVNGGSHGLDNFTSVFRLAGEAFEVPAAASAAAARSGKKAGKSLAATLPPSRRPAGSRSRTSKARKDNIDVRDRLFQPAPISLDDECPRADVIARFFGAYAKAGLILNQGREGACTGFGLSCVVNYLRWIKAGNPAKLESVSPRMLYTLARRYDEYEGEAYEGSTCRGAIKGWFGNGVCLESDWPYAPEASNPPRYGYAKAALATTLGVYYRIDLKSITDVQAAIAQHGAVFVSANTHDGWDAVPQAKKSPARHADLPVISFDGKRSTAGGHAFALVGFNAGGFVVQNSWGKDWGAGGFAVLQYGDWLTNAMDAWVVALGAPGVAAGRLVPGVASKITAAGADQSQWWDEGRAYQHSVVLGNDGRVDRYLTEDAQPRNLQHQCAVLPDAWFRTRPASEPKRLVIVIHGGLNSQSDAIKRASAMGRYFIGNGCFPLFMVWKTGILESIGNVFDDSRNKNAGLAGGFQWTDATDLVLENRLGRGLARPIWSEMKGNAELAFAPRRGGELLLNAIATLSQTWNEKFELHVIGHSAGSIFFGHMLTAMRARAGLLPALKTINIFAPACSVSFANQHYANDPAVMSKLHLDCLADPQERDDNVAMIYRKSLLYFVSAALETDLRTPILGLQRVADPGDQGWDGSSDTGEALAAWRQAAAAADLAARSKLVTTARVRTARTSTEEVFIPAAHGAFDNDIDVVGRTLQRIVGGELQMPVDDLRGY